MGIWLLLIWALLIASPIEADSNNTEGITYATRIWDACKSHHECKNLKYTQCFHSQCYCLRNYEIDNEKCLGQIDAPCDSDLDCHNRKEIGCIFNTCTIYKNFFTPSNAENIKLYRATGLGSRCQVEEHCSELYNTVCKSGKCSCARGYWRDDEVCKPVTNATCTEDSDCKERGTKCLLNNCILPADFFVESNSVNAGLYAAKNIGDSCQTDNHCRNVNNTGCLDNRCQCLRYWEEISNVCQKTLHIPCSDDSDCPRNKTLCILNTCIYPWDFFEPSNADKAHRYAATRIGIYKTCGSDHNCRKLKNTHCNNGQCICIPGYDNVNNNCQKAINVTCSDDSECLLPRSYCFLNTCLYPEDFFASSNNYNTSLYAAKRIDGYCQSNHHCREIDNSRCFGRRCSCKDGYIPNDNRCDSTVTNRI